jgi:hypothetical protein
MDAVADVETVEVNDQLLGDVVHVTDQRDPMTDDVEDAAAAQADRHLVVDEGDRYSDGNPGIGTDPHKIDMQGLIGRRMVLHIARQSAMDRIIHSDGDDRCEETAFGESAGQLAGFQADQHRIPVAAIDDPGDAAHAPRRSGGPFSGARAPLSAQGGDLGHGRRSSLATGPASSADSRFTQTGPIAAERQTAHGFATAMNAILN